LQEAIKTKPAQQRLEVFDLGIRLLVAMGDDLHRCRAQPSPRHLHRLGRPSPNHCTVSVGCR